MSLKITLAAKLVFLILNVVFLSTMSYVDAAPCSGQTAFVPQNVARIEGHAVYAIGDIDIYSVCPDFFPDTILQKGNHNPKVKIIPKKSSELKNNYVGATPPRLPRSEMGEEYPFRAIHLIDDDSGTYWRCRPMVADNLKDEWVRIDLPVEQKINNIVLIGIPGRDKNFGYQYGPYPAFPVDFKLEVSTDAQNWEKIYEAKDYPMASERPQEFKFAPKNAKQIRLVVARLRRCPGDDGRDNFALALSEFQVFSVDGKNVALISRGAGITVSSTDYGYATKRETNNLLWPIHYDLGVKWLKVGYFMDRTNWFHVEREKGKYSIDPVTDEAVTQAVNNGIEVVMTLCYGNPLYQDYGHQGRQKGFWETPYIGALCTDEAIEGYTNYCKFMVSHFRSRINYFEIWNNPDGEFGLEANPEPYIKTVKAASRAIKEANPDAKVILGGMSLMKFPFFESCFEGGLAPFVDVIAWHPYRLAMMPEESYTPGCHSYADWVIKLREMGDKYGFKGGLHANETTYLAAYPQNKEQPVRPDWNYDVSEITKAKYLARTVFIHAGLDVPVFWNETWNNQHVYRDVGLLRNGYSADPDSALTCQPAYYVMRTCCTALNGAIPAAISLKVSKERPELQKFGFMGPEDQKLAAIWLATQESENIQEEELDVTISDVEASEVKVIDILNGFEQQLNFVAAGNNTVINNLLIKDYPLLLCLKAVKE